MKKREEILETLRQLKPYLHEKFHVSGIAVFGSVARGEADQTSDVDIYVELDKPLGLEFVALGDELEVTLGIKVDLADRPMLKRLWPYIEADLVYV